MLNNIIFNDDLLIFNTSFTGDGLLIISQIDEGGKALFSSKIEFKQGLNYEFNLADYKSIEFFYINIIFDGGGSYLHALNRNEIIKVVFNHENNTEVMVPRYGSFSNKFAQRQSHEIGFRRIVSSLINNGVIDGNIIDLGAWIGDNAIPWALMQTNIVYAIDPSPENIQYVSNIARLNRCRNVITLLEAICDCERLISTNNDLHHAEFSLTQIGPTSLKSKSLDLLMDLGKLDNVSFIHLDVEGMEHLVFKGSTKLLNKYRPICSYEQHLNKDDVSGLVDWLSGQRYKSFIVNEVLPGCRPDCRNIFAIPYERLDILQYYYFKNFINEEKLLSEI